MSFRVRAIHASDVFAATEKNTQFAVYFSGHSGSLLVNCNANNTAVSVGDLSCVKTSSDSAPYPLADVFNIVVEAKHPEKVLMKGV